jgi:hypothetical protein
MLAWTLINRQFAKVAPREKSRAEDRYYEAFAGWSSPFRRLRRF